MDNNEFNFSDADCTSRGACALSPGLVSLQELALYFLKLASFYVIKLCDFNLQNSKINEEVINNIASLIYLKEYSEKQIHELALRCYYIFTNSKERYFYECSENNISPDIIDELISFKPEYSLTMAISSGDMLVKRFYNTVPNLCRCFVHILFSVLKSVCQNISKLFDFSVINDDAIFEALSVLCNLNKFEKNEKVLAEYINSLTSLDSELKLQLVNTLFTHYGEISNVMVSHSTRRGKCILVSGNNFNDLIQILEQTKDINVDVYTHSNLLICHCLEQFSKYHNLIGHYGHSSENCILDYATFPGAILLTKNSKNNTEYLYRGKIFSNDYITPQGVIKIENNNYSPVIETALNSVGFKKGRQKPDTDLGFDEKELDLLLNKLYQKLCNGTIKRLFVVGINLFSEVQKEYFDTFFSYLRTDEFTLCLGYESVQDNVITVNIGNYLPLAEYIFNKLLLISRKYLNKIFFIFPICDVMSISEIINLKNEGVNNVYTTSCSPVVVNPVVFDTFKNFYGIKILSNPVNDLREIRKNTSQ